MEQQPQELNINEPFVLDNQAKINSDDFEEQKEVSNFKLTGGKKTIN